MRRRKGQILPRIFIYLIGLQVMSLGVVLTIKSDLGAASWDVLHVGMYYHFGLTIGTWSMIVGLGILTASAIIAKEFPQMGAYANMFLVGLFIDFYMWFPLIPLPESLLTKTIIFALGLLFMGYGMGIYISAQLGAGPRDSLMLAITSRTGWKVRNVRSIIELCALIVGWRLGGPVFWGTIVYTLCIGQIAGVALPQCQKLTDFVLSKLNDKQKFQVENTQETKKGSAM